MIPNSIMSRSTITFLLLLLLNVLFVSKIHGEQKIMGAFGVKLGDYFDPSSAIGTGELPDGRPIYHINPEKKNRSFDRYFVMITPKTHKIYSIWGRGDVEHSDKCKEKQTFIKELLQKKYGNKEERFVVDFNPINGVVLGNGVAQGNRSVLATCSGTKSFSSVSNTTVSIKVDNFIEIRYHDDGLEKLAERERIEIEKERIEIARSKIDDSGL